MKQRKEGPVTTSVVLGRQQYKALVKMEFETGKNRSVLVRQALEAQYGLIDDVAKPGGYPRDRDDEIY